MKIKPNKIKSLFVAFAVGVGTISMVGCSHSEPSASVAGSNAATTAGASTQTAPEVKAQMDASRQADAARTAAMAAQMNAPKK